MRSGNRGRSLVLGALIVAGSGRVTRAQTLDAATGRRIDSVFSRFHAADAIYHGFGVEAVHGGSDRAACVQVGRRADSRDRIYADQVNLYV